MRWNDSDDDVAKLRFPLTYLHTLQLEGPVQIRPSLRRHLLHTTRTILLPAHRIVSLHTVNLLRSNREERTLAVARHSRIGWRVVARLLALAIGGCKEAEMGDGEVVIFHFFKDKLIGGEGSRVIKGENAEIVSHEVGFLSRKQNHRHIIHIHAFDREQLGRTRVDFVEPTLFTTCLALRKV